MRRWNRFEFNRGQTFHFEINANRRECFFGLFGDQRQRLFAYFGHESIVCHHISLHYSFRSTNRLAKLRSIDFLK